MASIIKISELVTTSDLVTTDPVIINTGDSGAYTTKSITSQEFITKALGWYGNVDGSILMIRSGNWAASPYTLPTDSGTAGQVLTTDGTNSSWQTVDTVPSLWEFDNATDAITPVPPASSFPVNYESNGGSMLPGDQSNGDGKCWSVEPVKFFSMSRDDDWYSNADLTVGGLDGAILSYTPSPAFDGKVQQIDSWEYNGNSKSSIKIFYKKADSSGNLMEGPDLNNTFEVDIDTNGIEIRSIYLTLGTVTYIHPSTTESITAEQLPAYVGPYITAVDNTVLINSPLVVAGIPINSGLYYDKYSYANGGPNYSNISIGKNSGTGLKIYPQPGAVDESLIYGNNATIAIGNRSLHEGGGNSLSIAIGEDALYKCSLGTFNVAIGSSALRSIGDRFSSIASLAFYNTAIGGAALLGCLNGFCETAIGYGAGQNYTGVDDDGSAVSFGGSIYLGYNAGYSTQCGVWNIAIGTDGGTSRVGSNNVMIGRSTLAEGDGNIAIGNYTDCGFYENNDSNIVIGAVGSTCIPGETSSSNILIRGVFPDGWEGDGNLFLGNDNSESRSYPDDWVFPTDGILTNSIMLSNRAYCDPDGNWNFSGDITANGVLLTGGGGVTSVNGQTHVVVLGIQDMDDFALNETTSCGNIYNIFAEVNPTSNLPTIMPGMWGFRGNSMLLWSNVDSNDNVFTRPGGGGNVEMWISGNGSTWIYKNQQIGIGDQVVPGAAFDYISSASLITQIKQEKWTSFYISLCDPAAELVDVPLAVGDALVWDGVADFRPKQFVNSVNTQIGPVSLGIRDMNDVVETSPLDGDVLVYDSAIEAFKYQTSLGVVDRVNGKTGDVVLTVSDVVGALSSIHGGNVNGDVTYEGSTFTNKSLQTKESVVALIAANGGSPNGGATRFEQQKTIPLVPGTLGVTTFELAGSSGTFISVENLNSNPSIVTFYASEDSFNADLIRDPSVQKPTPGDGVLLEVSFDGAKTTLITPAVHYFVVNTNEPLKARVRAKGTGSTPVDIKFTLKGISYEG